ncbi:hypothetical protein ACROYT_G021062 [Oculina patagonica]
MTVGGAGGSIGGGISGSSMGATGATGGMVGVSSGTLAGGGAGGYAGGGMFGLSTGGLTGARGGMAGGNSGSSSGGPPGTMSSGGVGGSIGGGMSGPSTGGATNAMGEMIGGSSGSMTGSAGGATSAVAGMGGGFSGSVTGEGVGSSAGGGMSGSSVGTTGSIGAMAGRSSGSLSGGVVGGSTWGGVSGLLAGVTGKPGGIGGTSSMGSVSGNSGGSSRATSGGIMGGTTTGGKEGSKLGGTSSGSIGAGGSSAGGVAGGAGGSAGAAGGATGAAGAGGISSGGTAGGAGGMSTGGMSTGGMSTGGMGAGGMGAGGMSTGGMSTGGMSTGGTSTGGMSTGGMGAGGVSTGGMSTGGMSTGGMSTGGMSTGGIAGGATGGAMGGAGGVAGLGPDCSVRPLHLPHLCGCQPCQNVRIVQTVGQGDTNIKGKREKERRSEIHNPINNSSIFDGKGRQIFDRGKANETNGNSSTKHSDRRKYTVLKITVVKHGGNKSTEEQKGLTMDDVRDGNVELSKTTPRNASQDVVRGTKVPLTFAINTKGSSEEAIPLNDLLSDNPLPNIKKPLSTSNTHLLPATEATESSKEKPGKFPDQSDPNVLLEAKLNPLRIGIRLDDDKKKESKTTSEEVGQVSLQDVLKDIDDTTNAAHVTPNQSENEKEKTVVINLNDGSIHANDSNVKQQHLNKNEEKQGKLRIQATNEKENKNGTEVNTAGVSITTESKGLQTDGLMKVLLSKLLGNDVTEALNEKVVQKLKSVGNPVAPNDYAGKQTPTTLDMASTNPTGTSVESPPGTIKGVDTAEMNNGVSDTTTPVEPPQMVATNPQCFGGGSQPLPLNSAGSRAPANIRLPGGRDCHYGLESVPSTHVASSSPTGMAIESAPGTQNQLDWSPSSCSHGTKSTC